MTDIVVPIQNFSIPAGDDDVITLQIPNMDLSGSTVYWSVYTQQFGIPTAGSIPIISKTSLDGGGLSIVSSPPVVLITMHNEDTVDLLRNYYHEARVVDVFSNQVKVVSGIMTVTEAEIAL